MRFKVNRCFSEVTPESAEEGEESDSGFVFKNETYSLRELIDLIKQDDFKREGKTKWLSTGYYTECYLTGTEREESLHIKLV